VGFGVEWSLSQEDGVFLRSHTQLVVEVKYLLHIVPVGDDAMLNGVFEGEDASLALCLISYVAVFLTHAHHH
ncbi:hypothetical protein C0J45_5139, partial [Silurus meridionalis]